MKSSLKDRLLAKAIPEPNSGCWLFDGYTTPDGYGRINVDGYSSPAHRVSYELFCGEIPAGKQIDHLCRNRCCVCPDHLEAVTPRENFERGLSPRFFSQPGRPIRKQRTASAGISSRPKTLCGSPRVADAESAQLARAGSRPYSQKKSKRRDCATGNVQRAVRRKKRLRSGPIARNTIGAAGRGFGYEPH